MSRPLVTFAVFMPVFAERAAAGTDGDRLLHAFFVKHTAHIAPHWDACLPETEWAQKCEPEGLAAEWHGPCFHKGFRQFDVICDRSRGASDMLVWHALGRPLSTAEQAGGMDNAAFWATHGEVLSYEIGAAQSVVQRTNVGATSQEVWFAYPKGIQGDLLRDKRGIGRRFKTEAAARAAIAKAQPTKEAP